MPPRRAGVVTPLLLLLRYSVAETEDRICGELLGDLLTRAADPGSLAARARRLKVDLGRQHSVFVLHAPAVPRPRLPAAAARTAQTRHGLAGTHHEEVVFVCPSDAPSAGAAHLAEELGQAVAAPVTVAAAGPVTGPEGFADAHAEALRCLSALRALGHDGRGAAPADLGVSSGSPSAGTGNARRRRWSSSSPSASRRCRRPAEGEPRPVRGAWRRATGRPAPRGCPGGTRRSWRSRGRHR
ncbi:hypothetical protein [Streptomyces sp. NPDC059874]|uniref:hypothetical protein n=1 Tax=Streptomyces sp. NPDC059874 TaxID=3346983 RepID=UPI00366113EF